ILKQIQSIAGYRKIHKVGRLLHIIMLVPGQLHILAQLILIKSHLENIQVRTFLTGLYQWYIYRIFYQRIFLISFYGYNSEPLLLAFIYKKIGVLGIMS